MPSEFPCPRCGQILRTPEDSTHQMVRCPACGANAPIPAAGRPGQPIMAAAVSESSNPVEAEAIRKSHINHEASVKSIGFLYYLGAVFMAFSTISAVAMFGRFHRPPDLPVLPFFLIMIAFDLGLVLLGVACGYGLRRLRGWVRIPVGILSLLGILGSVLNGFRPTLDPARAMPRGAEASGFACGAVFIALINVYILYLLFCQKGSTVFSREYQDVIALTPHIKYRTSIIVWILLVILVLVILLGVVGAIIATVR